MPLPYTENSFGGMQTHHGTKWADFWLISQRPAANPGDTSLEAPGTVPHPAIGMIVQEPLMLPSIPDPQSEQPGHHPNSSCVGYLRQRFKSQNLSEGASKLCLTSWRQKTAKSYDSLFNKWLGWCSDPEI